jgi:serine/threonine protein phosphatase PrpC
MARAGSCALVCVVVNNKVYSANAGDSLGLIIEQD